MRSGILNKPELGETLPSAHPSEDALTLLRMRRSTAADFLGPPGPDAETLADLLEIAARVPDHRRVVPPEWEQVLTTGAACQNLLVASSAHGFAAQWLTEWYAFDADVADALQLDDNERVAGFVYIGAAREGPKERGRPDMASIVSTY